jgi:hypothetical protein
VRAFGRQIGRKRHAKATFHPVFACEAVDVARKIAIFPARNLIFGFTLLTRSRPLGLLLEVNTPETRIVAQPRVRGGKCNEA